MPELPLEDGHPSIDVAEQMDLDRLPKFYLTASQIGALKNVFGESAAVPNAVCVGHIAFCAHDTTTLQTMVVVTDPWNEYELVHEVAHYLVFTLIPHLAVTSDRERHEAWADLAVAMWAHELTLPNLLPVMTAFFGGNSNVV